MTSHDVVNRLRKILNMKKIGHSGTLDPNATGVLLVMLGNATKVLPFLEDTDKEYVAEMVLGKRTLSDDIWGEVLEERPVKKIEDFQGILDTFRGEQIQVPPMISSVRVNGRKLYEYARAHEEVERPKRKVHIYEIEALDLDTLKFRVSCSSGTYVRSLCHDIAEKTGNVGCMSSLVRTKVGKFSIDDCVTLEEVAQGHVPLRSVSEILSHYPKVTYEPLKDIYNGKHVRIACPYDDIVVVDSEGVAVAIYQRDHNDVFRSIRGLW